MPIKLPYNKELKETARKLRKAGNLSEVLLWQHIKAGQLSGFNITRQKIIGNYIVDFYCAELELVIEIDGASHDLKGDYDEKRDNYLKSLGLTVLHFADKDVRKSLDEVLSAIEEWIKNNKLS